MSFYQKLTSQPTRTGGKTDHDGVKEHTRSLYGQAGYSIRDFRSGVQPAGRGRRRRSDGLRRRGVSEPGLDSDPEHAWFGRVEMDVLHWSRLARQL